MIATFTNAWSCVRSVAVLVRCGGSVSAEDDEGRTPAFLALLYACTPAAAAILAFPQSLEHTTKVGTHPPSRVSVVSWLCIRTVVKS